MAERITPQVFKFYIHDGADACRLQLLGSFTEPNVHEINGCWETAKTVLGDRKLIIDLNGLESADEAGRMWLAALAAEGASVVPEKTPKSQRKSTLAGKLGCLLRAVRLAEAEPSTPIR